MILRPISVTFKEVAMLQELFIVFRVVKLRELTKWIECIMCGFDQRQLFRCVLWCVSCNVDRDKR